MLHTLPPSLLSPCSFIVKQEGPQAQIWAPFSRPFVLTHEVDKGAWFNGQILAKIRCELVAKQTRIKVDSIISCWSYVSGGSNNQNLWGQLVRAVGPSHICYSKFLLISSKAMGLGGPKAYTCIRHCSEAVLAGPKLEIRSFLGNSRPCVRTYLTT
jgi:hypothetical protein